MDYSLKEKCILGRQPSLRKEARPSFQILEGSILISQYSIYSISAKKVTSFRSCGMQLFCLHCLLMWAVDALVTVYSLHAHVTMYSMTTQFGGSICCHCLSTAWPKNACRWLCFASDFLSACCCHLFKYVQHPLPAFVQRFSCIICKFSWNSPLPYLSLREATPSLTLRLEERMNGIQQRCPMFQFHATGLSQANLPVPTGVVFKLSADTSSATTNQRAHMAVFTADSHTIQSWSSGVTSAHHPTSSHLKGKYQRATMRQLDTTENCTNRRVDLPARYH